MAKKAGAGKTGAGAAAAGAGLILFTLAAGQFLMALDTSVMNVSIATVAEDLERPSPGCRRPSPFTRW